MCGRDWSSDVCSSDLAALLVFVEGYKYSETAEILDVPIGTVMSRVAAARMTLRSQLEQIGRASCRERV